VNLSGMASARGEVFAAKVKAEVGRQIRNELRRDERLVDGRPEDGRIQDRRLPEGRG
jgi:hypothetical protein